MQITVQSGAVSAVSAIPIAVVVTVQSGLPRTQLTGMSEHAARETVARVAQAITSEGIEYPRQRVLIDLRPCHTSMRVGMDLDLPITVGILAASGAVPAERLAGVAFLGEVWHDGCLRYARGAGAIAEACAAAGCTAIVVPQGAAAEVQAMVGERMQVLAASTLGEVMDWLRGRRQLLPPPAPRTTAEQRPAIRCIDEHPAARRAIEIAAAGGHGLLLVGAAGAPTWSLAAELSMLLPDPTPDDRREMTRIRSACGLLPRGAGLAAYRPFRAPHPSITPASLVGRVGVVGLPELGELSLAHRGVLLLGDLAEWSERTLRALREAMTDGPLPHDALLVASANRCPCVSIASACTCPPEALAAYRSRVLHLAQVLGLDLCASVQATAGTPERPTEGPASLRQRIAQARQQAAVREAGDGYDDALDDDAREALGLWERAYATDGALDAEATRARLVRIARTIADLAAEDTISAWSIAEAAGLTLDAQRRG